ncbi:UNVERIFIED_CONTAM: hypothetical protein GTU68_055594 [Idotea baltica]|nr:hypothetical protein [Idotea baltica]
MAKLCVWLSRAADVLAFNMKSRSISPKMTI